MSRFAAISSAVLVSALLIGTFVYIKLSGPVDNLAECRTGTVSGGAGSIGGPFELVDETGQTVTEKDVITGPTVVYFGYTFCPDVCPLDAARNSEAVTLLEDRGYSVKPVFITIDPERDTPEALAEFTDVMHPDMLGLTGSIEQVRQASKAYRTYFKKQQPEKGDEEYYLVDHSTFSYFMMPETGFVDFFRNDESADEMASRLQCFLDNM